jgi:hypothetical protein
MMTLYGKANPNLDIWFTTKFKATKTKDKECKEQLNYFYKKDKEIPSFEFKSVDVTPDKNGDYQVEIPLEIEEVKCAYEVVDVVLYVGKKGYGEIGNRIDSSLNAVYIYAPNTNENYFMTRYKLTYSNGGESSGSPKGKELLDIEKISPKNTLWELPKNEYYILAPESKYECQYSNNHDIGLGTQIRCSMKITKGEIGRVEPIDKNTTLKIDIVLNDIDRDGNKYYPKKDYEEYKDSERNPDNWGLLKKMKYKILGD